MRKLKMSAFKRLSATSINYQDRKKQMSKMQPSLTTVSQRTTKAKFSLFIMSRPGCYSILVVTGVRTYL